MALRLVKRKIRNWLAFSVSIPPAIQLQITCSTVEPGIADGTPSRAVT
jgi:hypothetical protein